MALRKICYVTNRIEDGPAFAIREDNDEHVFITSTIAKELDLEEMDAVEAILVANTSDAAQNTPWFATRARVLEDDELE